MFAGTSRHCLPGRHRRRRKATARAPHRCGGSSTLGACLRDSRQREILWFASEHIRDALAAAPLFGGVAELAPAKYFSELPGFLSRGALTSGNEAPNTLSDFSEKSFFTGGPQNENNGFKQNINAPVQRRVNDNCQDARGETRRGFGLSGVCPGTAGLRAPARHTICSGSYLTPLRVSGLLRCEQRRLRQGL